MYDRLEPLVAALAWLHGREVRMVASREEASPTTRHGAGVISSMSADAEGNLTSAVADVRYDTGAYADIGPRITAKSGMVAAGPYKIPNVAILVPVHLHQQAVGGRFAASASLRSPGPMSR